ncbi:MAG: site-2 protease family protein [Planctomycetota bacterium]|nr:site-2 protease family protein [Planctomycetota bacterium]
MTLNDLISVLLVPLGIGLVIFVHELGHFMAARWCGARVEVFSLGFGAKLFGWRRGETLFQVAAIPLGGYVRVAGEYPDGKGPAEEGTLASLNVPQRFLYYSGGVIMNVIFALVVLPLVMFAGLPAESPIIGTPTPGMPAWEAGVPAGSVIVSINGEEIVDFQHLVTAVAVNGKEPMEIVAATQADARSYTVTPVFDEEDGIYRIGVPFGFDPAARLLVRERSPAAEAGLAEGDRLLEVVGAPQGLPLDRQLIGPMTRGEAVTVLVQDAEGVERTVTVEPTRSADGPRRIGVASTRTLVESVRTTGPAAEVIADLGIRGGDRLRAVEGVLVTDLRSLETALLGSTPGSTLAIEVERDGVVERLEAVIPDGLEPVRIAGDLHLETIDGSVAISVVPGTPAERAGLRSGDEVISINGRAMSSWSEILEAIQAVTAEAGTVSILAYRGDPDPVSRKREEVVVDVVGEPVVLPDYGFALGVARFTLKAASLGEAVAAGTRATQRFLSDVWRQLKKMLFTDEISSKNLGGIISISVISFDTASQGLPKLFFFLAILSINLAIINLLPIPILDGGHLLFLLVEAIKGSPVSERTFGYSQVVGLVMIMSLMVYVTYQDIVRWILKT